MEQRMKDILNNAITEIHTLRRRNEILTAKVDTMEFLAMVLDTQPYRTPSHPMSIDIIYELNAVLLTEEENARSTGEKDSHE